MPRPFPCAIAKFCGWWLIPIVVAGCYSQNQAALQKSVRELVAVGMSIPTVKDRMTSSGFACSGTAPITCARVRQRILSSCVERVNLEQDLGTLEVVRIDVPPIVCAGL
jgi:hypothetical protein